MEIKAENDLNIAYSLLSEVQKFFEPMGINSSTVNNCINKLYSRRLVESFDPSIDVLGDNDRIRITPSGMAHIELALKCKMYVSNIRDTQHLYVILRFLPK